MKLTLVENSRDREFSLTSDTMRTLQEDETCGALGVDLPWLATSRVCIVYIGVHVDTYDIDRQKSKSMAANIVCAPVPWAWTYPGWPPPLDLLGTCRWGSPAHQSTHSHKTTWRPFLFNQPCPMISYYLTIISKRKYLTNTFHF